MITKFIKTVFVFSVWAMMSGCGFLDYYRYLEGDSISNDVENTNLSGGIRQTGQRFSYDSNGTRVSDGTIMDDGYYHAGTLRRYQRDAHTSIVKDMVGGLQWEDTSHVLAEKTLQPAAHAYCTSLTLGGHSDWRLPTMKELYSLLRFFDDDHTIMDDQFKYVKNSIFLSGTIVSEQRAGYVQFGYKDRWWSLRDIKGSVGGGDKANTRCVRGSDTFLDGYTREDGMVINTKLNFYWQDNQEPEEELSWQDAIRYCEELTLGDFDDWRLPNLNEFAYIRDASFELFSERDRMWKFWTSTTFFGKIIDPSDATGDPIISSGQYAFAEYVSLGIAVDNKASETNKVRCVRGGTLHIDQPK